LPKSLHIIQQQRAFEGCKKVRFSSDANIYFAIEKEILFNASKTTLIAWPSASGEISIPNHVKRIEEYAFSGCSELSKIVMQNQIDVCDTAFSNCNKLLYENIVWPNSDLKVKDISLSTLNELFVCKTLDNGVYEIRTGCYYDDKEKTEIVLRFTNREDFIILDDCERTVRYLDNYFHLPEQDVKRNIIAITRHFGVHIMQTQVIPFTSHLLFLRLQGKEELERGFLKMMYCIGCLNHMKIFYV